MNEEQMVFEFSKNTDWAKGREKDIVHWLENFQPDHRELALQLLRGIRSYSVDDYKKWCKTLHGYLPLAIRQSTTVFYVSLGWPSESGSLVSFYYRTANGLAVEQFLDLSQASDVKVLKNNNAQSLVFLDDFIGSGNQAIEFWYSLSSHLGQHINVLQFFYSAFIGYREGKANIEKNTKFKVNMVRQLDESDKAFGTGSSLFPGYVRGIAKTIFKEYGERLFPRHPLGYREGQTLIVFEHNTPNNTLPVLWSSEDNWFPLFKRYEKVHLPGSAHSGATARSGGEAIRKAIMFTDRVNSTSSIAGRMPLETGDVMFEQTTLMTDVVRQCGGTITKSVGDGALIEFPSSKSALLCGFILQQRVKARNEGQNNPRLRFELRVGIDTGEVVMLPDGNLVGSAANRAARVCSQCPPGEVYFTEAVKSEIDESEAKFLLVGAFRLKGLTGKESIYRLIEWKGSADFSVNPFIWRGGITRADDFFNRTREQRVIRDYLRGRQNCQIVGPRRIGKTSLLRQVERLIAKWDGSSAVTAYMDLQSPRSFTLAGWLEQAGRQLNLSSSLASLADFFDAIESALAGGIHPVLLLDEFEEFVLRPTEFTRDFFVTLRACGQRGLSIVTATRQPLSEITEPNDLTSPFYNTFPLLPLGTFSQADAKDFVSLDRVGISRFTSEERKAILGFAKGHPLALQVASFHALEAKQRGELLIAAMSRATDDMRAHLPSW